MVDDEDKLARLRKALEGEAEDDDNDGSIIGETVTIGNNNCVIINKISTSAELTPAQKLRLTELVGSIVAVAAAKGHPVAYQQIWRRFQKHFLINSYHVLPAELFSSAESFLKGLYVRAKRGDNLNVRGPF